MSTKLNYLRFRIFFKYSLYRSKNVYKPSSTWPFPQTLRHAFVESDGIYIF